MSNTVQIDRHDAQTALTCIRTVRDLSIKQGLFHESSLLAHGYNMTIEALESALGITSQEANDDANQ